MADEITDAEIAELRRLCEAATPGPWTRKWSGVVGAGDDGICTNGRGGNNHEWIDEGNLCMDLIAAMHSALPGLLARLERAERERDEARTQLTARIASIMHNPDVDSGSLAAGLIREGRERERKDSAARIATLERERDEARQSNARMNRRAQEAEAAAERLRKIEARIAERDARKPLPRIEAAFALAAAEARIATLERELSRWRGCEQVEGDYVCKHEFECSQILRPRIATLEAALLPLAAHARSEAMRAAEGSERKRIMDKWATAAETALRGVEGKP